MLTESDFEVFDGDKHMTDLSARFTETPSKDLWNYINILSSLRENKLQLNPVLIMPMKPILVRISLWHLLLNFVKMVMKYI